MKKTNALPQINFDRSETSIAWNAFTEKGHEFIFVILKGKILMEVNSCWKLKIHEFIKI
jgi:hypothetical protein